MKKLLLFIREKISRKVEPVEPWEVAHPHWEEEERKEQGRLERIAHMLGVLQGYPPPPESNPPTQFMKDVSITHRRCVIVIENDSIGDEEWSPLLKDAIRKAIDMPDFDRGSSGKTYEFGGNKVTVHYTSHFTDIKIPETVVQLMTGGSL